MSIATVPFTGRLPVRRLAAFALAVAASAPSLAQQYPNKPVRLLVTAAAGGITDIMARIVAEPVSRNLGQPLIVENRPGADGNIAVGMTAKSPSDGYTIVIVNVGSAAIVRWISKDLGFDPMTDVVGVAPVGEVPSIAAIPDSLPAKTLREFIDYARANPGKVNYGSAGTATMPHLAAVMLGNMTGTSMVHVPYKGGGPAAVDLAAGRIQLGLLGIGSLQAQFASGQVRPLAVAAKQRLVALPAVPTFDEAGVPGYDVTNWFGIQAPKGTPREVLHTINSSFGRAFDNPAVVQRFTDAGILPMRESVDDFQKRIASDDAKWRDVVKSAGIKAD